jgi:hypothetical protein
MSLQWTDGFEKYDGNASNADKVYTTATIITSTIAAGRFGGNCLNCNGSGFNIITPQFGNHATWTVGFAFKNINTTGTYELLRFNDALSSQISLVFNGTTDILSVKRGVTTLGTGTKVLTDGAWYYIEIKATIDNSVGAAEVRVSEQTDISLTNVDTQTTVNAYANNFSFMTPGNSYQLDDLYILDGAGSVNTTFLGDIKIETLLPVAEGATAEWTATTGNRNYEAVQTQGDGELISSITNGNVDTYIFNNLLTINTQIKGANVFIMAKNDDSTTHNISATVRQGGVNYFSSTQNINDTAFKYKLFIYEKDPTDTSWSVSNINANEYGVKLVS